MIPSRHQRSRAHIAALAVAAFWTSGCATTVALDHAVVSYDKATTDSIEKQLLLNIARAHRSEPIHFTAISSIAATYKLSFSAGVVGAATGENGNLLVPMVGLGVEENPTISIAPMEGEEFTQRLLTPFPEEKLTLLLRQGYDVDSLLRLLGAEIHFSQADGRSRPWRNRPSDREGYEIYRRVMAHLSSIQDRHSLYVEPLHFQLVWTVPSSDVTPETLESTYRGFTLSRSATGDTFTASKRVNGRVMVTNYDPDTLSNDERVSLHAEADQAPVSDFVIDIRPGFPGGEYPFHARLRLRSFHEVLTFLGRGIHEEPEYDVPPDPRTPGIRENPVRTLGIAESASLSVANEPSVRLHGRVYSLESDDGYQWNKKAFSLLYQLFQMSVSTDVNKGPEITIAK
jgi:hypothetical protein